MNSPETRTFAAALGALTVAFAAPPVADAEVRAAERVFEFRADHMVLDAAVRGSQLLAGTQSGRVDVFDWREGKTQPPLLGTPPAEDRAFAPTVPSVAVSPSGSLCAVISSDGKLRVFRFDADAAGEPFFRTERIGLLIARFLNEDKLLVGDLRGELELIDLATGSPLYRRQLEYDPIYALAPSPDGRRVAVAFRSSRIQIVASDGGETLLALDGHRDSVFGLAWLNDGQLASAGKDKHLLLWDLRQSHPAPRVLYAGDHYITALAAEPGAALLALPLEDHQVGLLRIADGRIVQRLSGHTAPVHVLLFADGGSTLISAGNDARVLVWNLAGKSAGSRR
jgi:WD40 repeat protein